MNVSAIIGAFAQARITPADAVSRGQYEIGMRKALVSFPNVDQVYSISAVGVPGDGSVQLATALGTLSWSGGGAVTGGGGVDPDGNPVEMSEIYALHMRNTGDQDIFIETAAGSGNHSVTQQLIQRNGEILHTFPLGLQVPGELLDISGLDLQEPISFDLTVFGQMM